MKSKFRRTLSLVLSLVLICALAVTAFASTEMNRNSESYTYDNVIMRHEIIGFDDYARAVISFAAVPGSEIPDDFSFDYDGYIDYQYCREDQVRPDYYIGGRKTGSGTCSTTTSVISTGHLSSGYAMIDASMCFTTQFDTEHATIIHKRPDTIYVGIY